MDGFDSLAMQTEPLAKTTDVRVDGARVRLRADSPDLLEELCAGKNTPGMLDEDGEQLVLERAKAELRAINRDAMTYGVDLEPSPPEAFAFVDRTSREPTFA